MRKKEHLQESQQEILTDEAGKRRFEEQLEKLTKERKELKEELHISAKAELNIEEAADIGGIKDHIAYLDHEISELVSKINRCIIVDKDNKEENSIISIGDILLIHFIFDEGDEKDEEIRLVSTNPDIYGQTQEVSIKSPLGSAIYNRMLHERITVNVKNDLGTMTYTVIVNGKK